MFWCVVAIVTNKKSLRFTRNLCSCYRFSPRFLLSGVADTSTHDTSRIAVYTQRFVTTNRPDKSLRVNHRHLVANFHWISDEKIAREMLCETMIVGHFESFVVAICVFVGSWSPAYFSHQELSSRKHFHNDGLKSAKCEVNFTRHDLDSSQRLRIFKDGLESRNIWHCLYYSLALFTCKTRVNIEISFHAYHVLWLQWNLL